MHEVLKGLCYPRNLDSNFLHLLYKQLHAYLFDNFISLLEASYQLYCAAREEWGRGDLRLLF